MRVEVSTSSRGERHELGTSGSSGEQGEAKVPGPASYFPAIEKKYGKSISEWQTLVRASGLAKHGELVTWLKTQHGMGHGHANAIVAHTLAEDAGRI